MTLDPGPRAAESAEAPPPIDTAELSYYGSVGLGCAVVALWLLVRAPGDTAVHRVFFCVLVFGLAGVGAYHLSMAAVELQQPLHRDMPTGELALGLVLGLVAGAVFWGRAHSKQRANVQPSRRAMNPRLR